MLERIKGIKKYPNFIKAVIMSFVPLAAGCLLCAFYGKGIWDLSLIVSEWNDELFYYKQVEAVLSHGIPQGYFGFDESHAVHLSMAAWSPVLLMPYLLWGLLFGWNLLSPILCNIFFSMLAVFLFTYLTKPSRKQCIALGVLYTLSLFTTRYMLSGMAEATCAFWLIVYLGFLINYRQEEKTWKLVVLFVLVGIVTLIRPYYLIFILLPAYFLFQKNKLWGIVVSLLAMGGFSILYFAITKNFCAPYFVDIIKTDWLKQYQWAGLWEGFKYTVKTILDSAQEYISLCALGIKGDSERSGLALQFLVVLVVLVVQTVIDGIKKRKTELELHLFITGCYFVILTALFLMYQLMAGSRHFVVLITLSVFVISRMEGKWFLQVLITGVLLCAIYVRVPERLLYCELPFKTAESEQEFSDISQMLEENMSMNQEEVPSFDNVVIWTLSDSVDGTDTMTRWQLLYAVPKGYGINCCSGGYVQNNFETLRSRYLAVPPNGSLDKRCQEEGKQEAGRTQNIVIYDMKQE